MLFRCTTRMKKSRRLELHQHRVGLRNRCLPQSATSASELQRPLKLAEEALALPSTQSASPVMHAAENAAKVVDGWSDAKKDYAERVTSSHISTTSGSAAK